jgi:hypothetical protein
MSFAGIRSGLFSEETSDGGVATPPFLFYLEERRVACLFSINRRNRALADSTGTGHNSPKPTGTSQLGQAGNKLSLSRLTRFFKWCKWKIR